nr:MAG TPA: hypothetical protein [Caudoviricetes sp.]DAW28574.1 MAG TPA: hypothetical protein [Caudoviricetes sp.]
MSDTMLGVSPMVVGGGTQYFLPIAPPDRG